MLIAGGPVRSPSDAALANFANLSRAVGQEIAMIDAEGVVREGMLRAASANDVTMQFGSTERIFQRDSILSAERLRDGRLDGAIKGAVFGVMLALTTASDSADFWVTSIVLYSGIGYAIDASQTNRVPLYKTTASKPALKVSLRF
jgi:hypothetical protein